MFIVNDKGTSWAYATPGFSNSLNADLLKQLRTLAHVPEQAKLITEVSGTVLQAAARQAAPLPGIRLRCLAVLLSAVQQAAQSLGQRESL